MTQMLACSCSCIPERCARSGCRRAERVGAAGAGVLLLLAAQPRRPSPTGACALGRLATATGEAHGRAWLCCATLERDEQQHCGSGAARHCAIWVGGVRRAAVRAGGWAEGVKGCSKRSGKWACV